jgi:hypothetical protein
VVIKIGKLLGTLRDAARRETRDGLAGDDARQKSRQIGELRNRIIDKRNLDE